MGNRWHTVLWSSTRKGEYEISLKARGHPKYVLSLLRLRRRREATNTRLDRQTNDLTESISRRKNHSVSFRARY